MKKNEALSRLQSVELEMLRVFRDWCAEKEITWFIDSGTVIGAIRHQGFIPWDDDIDVGLPREDYNRLLLESAIDFPEGYSIHTSDDYGYTSLFAKMYKDGTAFDTDSSLQSECKQAIYIDLFPYDYLPVSKKERRRQGVTCANCQRLMYLYYLSDIAVPHRGVLGVAERVACKLGHCIVGALIDPHLIQAKFDAAVDFGGQVGTTMMSLPWYGYVPEYEEDTLIPTVSVQFEGLKVPAPHNPVKYLEQLYGDWETIPPVEERHTHMPRRLVFDNGDEWRDEDSCKQ